MALKLKMKPLGSRVVVEPIEQEDITPSGLVLPETAKEKPKRVRFFQSVPVIAMKRVSVSLWMLKLAM
jgi:co-chaperonin GroES (HSP10)